MIEQARARRRRRCPSGLLGNAAEVLPELLRRGVRPDAVTDQTSAHDPVHGYLPDGWTVEQLARGAGDAIRRAWRRPRARPWPRTCAPCSSSRQAGVPVFDYGNNIRQVAFDEGVTNAFDFPGFVPAYIRPLFCRGIGPFRWVALSGDPEDIYATDRKVKELMPDDPGLHRWLDMAAQPHPLPGAAGAHLLGRASATATASASRSTRWCASGELQGPGRHRPRSPGFRLGGEPEPRDRGACATARTRSPTGRS